MSKITSSNFYFSSHKIEADYITGISVAFSPILWWAILKLIPVPSITTILKARIKNMSFGREDKVMMLWMGDSTYVLRRTSFVWMLRMITGAFSRSPTVIRNFPSHVNLMKDIECLWTFLNVAIVLRDLIYHRWMEGFEPISPEATIFWQGESSKTDTAWQCLT